MKKMILISVSLLSLSICADELTWVDQQIEAIKPPRSGLKSSTLASIENPFIFLQKNKKEVKNKQKSKASTTKGIKNTIVAKKKFTFTLGAVLNKSALISGKWYKLNDKVNGYKLSKIEPTSVVLTKNRKKMVLSTRSTSKNLKFKNN